MQEKRIEPIRLKRTGPKEGVWCRSLPRAELRRYLRWLRFSVAPIAPAKTHHSRTRAAAMGEKIQRRMHAPQCLMVRRARSPMSHADMQYPARHVLRRQCLARCQRRPAGRAGPHVVSLAHALMLCTMLVRIRSRAHRASRVARKRPTFAARATRADAPPPSCNARARRNAFPAPQRTPACSGADAAIAPGAWRTCAVACPPRSCTHTSRHRIGAPAPTSRTSSCDAPRNACGAWVHIGHTRGFLFQRVPRQIGWARAAHEGLRRRHRPRRLQERREPEHAGSAAHRSECGEAMLKRVARWRYLERECDPELQVAHAVSLPLVQRSAVL